MGIVPIRPKSETVASLLELFRPGTSLMQSLRGLLAIGRLLVPLHVLRDVIKAVLSAVAKERKRLTATAPKLPRGRPSTKAAKRAARRKKRIDSKVSELFEHRYTIVGLVLPSVRIP